MTPQKKGTIRILNIGAAPLRAVDNISHSMPKKIAVFKQENPNWNDQNEEYRRLILHRFYSDPLVKVYKEAGNIDDIQVSTCMEYYCVFKALFGYIQKKHRKFDIEIDASGFTKEAFAAAQNVAACFDNIDVCYARSEKSDTYTAQRYGTGDDRSGPEVLIPITRVGIENLENIDSRHHIVFQAVYRVYLQGKHPNEPEQSTAFTSNAVKAHINGEKKKQKEPPKVPAGSITQILRKFHSDGLIRMDAASARVYNIEMTPFGIGLGQALEL